ncbi:MAG: hypothetical protein NTW52_01145 [Planctomycetota bacterium]|nr:hypothetical protein [Planctomycetota bacterium]
MVCNLCDAELEALAILMMFASALASLVARRVVQGVDEYPFKTSAPKNLANLFWDIVRANYIDSTEEACSDGTATRTTRLTLRIERMRILLQSIFGRLANIDRTH